MLKKKGWQPKVIKNGTKYKSIDFDLTFDCNASFPRRYERSNMTRRLRFLNTSNFLAAGYNLDTFIKSFTKGQIEKSFFHMNILIHMINYVLTACHHMMVLLVPYRKIKIL